MTFVIRASGPRGNLPCLHIWGAADSVSDSAGEVARPAAARLRTTWRHPMKAVFVIEWTGGVEAWTLSRRGMAWA